MITLVPSISGASFPVHHFRCTISGAPFPVHHFKHLYQMRAQNANAFSSFRDVGSFIQLWGRIPLTRPIVARYWRIPPSEVPEGTDEIIDWLYGWWERIDQWITERESEPKK